MEINEYPLVSFCIVAYNAEDYIEEALDAAFAQDYPNMEIIVSDDCSTDSTYEIIKNKVASYKGSSRVILNRNKPNKGVVPNYNLVLSELSHGDILVIADGDDISLPDRVTKCVEQFLADPAIMAVVGKLVAIDAKGKILDRITNNTECGDYSIDNDYMKNVRFMAGDASMAIRKSVMSFYPLMHRTCPTEDSPLHLRAMMMGKIRVVDDVYVRYRFHETNVSKPENIIKLSTNEVVSQYIDDIEYAYARKIIDSHICGSLKRKAMAYKIDRHLSVLKSQCPKAIRAILRMMQWVNIKYLKCLN